MIFMGIDEIRKEIDAIDDKLVELLRQRLDAVARITAYKIENDLPVDDAAREKEIHSRAAGKLGKSYAPYGEDFFDRLFEISRAYQQKQRDAEK